MYIKDQNTNEVVSDGYTVNQETKEFTCSKDNVVIALDNIDGYTINSQGINCRIFCGSSCVVNCSDYSTVSAKQPISITHGASCKVKNLTNQTEEVIKQPGTFTS